MLTGATSKAKDHAKSAGELRAALGPRPEASSAEKAVRDLITVKGDVEYGTRAARAVNRCRVLALERGTGKGAVSRHLSPH
jgi:hypothetical protein